MIRAIVFAAAAVIAEVIALWIISALWAVIGLALLIPAVWAARQGTGRIS